VSAGSVAIRFHRDKATRFGVPGASTRFQAARWDRPPDGIYRKESFTGPRSTRTLQPVGPIVIRKTMFMFLLSIGAALKLQILDQRLPTHVSIPSHAVEVFFFKRFAPSKQPDHRIGARTAARRATDRLLPYLYRIRGLTAAYGRSAIRLAKTTPTTTPMAIIRQESCHAFEKPVPPRFRDLPLPQPQKAVNAGPRPRRLANLCGSSTSR